MANPQKEDGHLQIANEIVEAFCTTRINGVEMQILWVVLRKTYGFNKKQDQISLGQFQKSTNIARSSIVRAIRHLVTRGILGSYTGVTSKPSTYWFIKDYEKWGSYTGVTRGSYTGVQKVVTRVSPTKDNIQKTNTNTLSEFEKAWAEYPNKDGKKVALRHYLATVKNEADASDCLLALSNYKKSVKNRRQNGQSDLQWKNGSTWFNNWRDWISWTPEQKQTTRLAQW